MRYFRNPDVKNLCLLLGLVTLGATIAGFLAGVGTGCLVLLVCLLFCGICLGHTLWRHRQMERLADYLRRITAGEHAPDVRDNGEGELSILKSEIYKVTVMLGEYNDQLQAEKLQLADSLADISHQLKTPLTSIRGYIELLKSEERDRQTALSFYEIIEIEAERLQKLTDDLLQLSDIEHGGGEAEVVPVPLEEVVDRVIATLRPEAEARNIALHPFIEPGLQVCAQSGRLYQLIKNLMENAVKYNRDGGAVNLSAAVERGVAVIRVHDTGIGIPPEHLERIFERFYRVDKGRSRELGGTGLGLSIVKHIVSLYGGDVRVDSAVGVGTTFTVRLPCR